MTALLRLLAPLLLVLMLLMAGSSAGLCHNCLRRPSMFIASPETCRAGAGWASKATAAAGPGGRWHTQLGARKRKVNSERVSSLGWPAWRAPT
jgi:hypothetical protein